MGGIGTKTKLGTTPTKKKAVRRKREVEELLGISKVDARDATPPIPQTWATVQGGDAKRALLAELRLYVDTYYQIQATRIGIGNRIGGLKRDAGMPQEKAEAFHDYLGARVERIEAELKAAISRIVLDHPIWTTWLSRVRGAGPIVLGGFLAYAGGPHYHALRDESEAKALERQGKKVMLRELHAAQPGMKPWEKEDGEGDGGGTDEPLAKGWYEETDGIATWATVSKWWTYCGLGLRPDGTIQRREKGVRGNWSPVLKVHSWKCSSVLVLAGGAYYDLYRQTKERLAKREPMFERLDQPDPRLLGRLLIEPTAGLEAGRMVTGAVLARLRRDLPGGSVRLGWRKGHIDAQARRWLAKVFGGTVWKVWRELEGLPAPAPYAIDHLGHQTPIPPLMDREASA